VSYILDALKKSDRERKRGDVPNLQTVHIPINNMQTQTPWLLYGFISFLLLSLAFVIGMMISAKDDASIAMVSEASTGVETAELNEPSIPIAEKNQSPIVKRNVKTKADNVVPKKVQAKTIQPNKGRPEIKQQVISQVKAPPAKPPSAAALDLTDIPYLNELPDYQQQSVPQMSFAGHVYSSIRASRTVIINNVAMSEGDTIVQGINVVEITPSGVVFSLHDILFRMDILQDWSFE
jgi:general secretion pathway protein B